MEAALIKKGAVLECASVAVTTPGLKRSHGLIIPGTKVKIMERGEQYRCMVLPVEESNGPTYVLLYPSQLREIRAAL